MPIRFRCAYCNQLMGIAKRKAGTVVRCPKCAGQVIVPDPGAVAPEPSGPANGPPPAPSSGGPALFERSDFGDMFDAPPLIPPSPPAPQPAPPEIAPPPFHAAPFHAAAPPPATPG